MVSQDVKDSINENKPFLIICAIALLAGIILFFNGSIAKANDIQLRSTYKSTEGVLFDSYEVYHEGDEDSDSYYDYVSRIEYRVDSKRYTLDGFSYSTKSSVPIGNKYKILYDPENPAKSIIEGTSYKGEFRIGLGKFLIFISIIVMFGILIISTAGKKISLMFCGLSSAYGLSLLAFGILEINKEIIKYRSVNFTMITGMIVIIASIVCLLWSLSKYKENIIENKKIKDAKNALKNPGENEALQLIGIYEKSKLFTKEIKILKSKMEETYCKLQDIDNKICKLQENIKLLNEEKKNAEIIKAIEKQEKIRDYFYGYFDNYAALYYNIFLQIKIELFKNSNKASIGIKDYISELKSDKEKISKVLSVFRSYSSSRAETMKSIEKINSTIRKIKASLIAYHSDLILSNISPVEDEQNTKLLEGYDDIFVMINDLDNHYERFIQEKNIVNNSF